MSLQAECEWKRGEVGDEELVAAIRESDERAFAMLYTRYFQRVYNFAFLRLRNHADTEDAVQETFTAVFQSIDRFRGSSSLLSWIYGIAKNTVNNTIRRAAARDRRVDRAETALVRDLEWSTAGTPEEDLTLRRCAESVREEFESLSDWQAEIFVLRHVENLSIDDISTRTTRSHDAVRSSLCRVKRLVVAAIESGHPRAVDAIAERSPA